MANCKFCGEQTIWKEKDGSWIMLNLDGNLHNETCERFVKDEEELIMTDDRQMAICPSCGIRVSIAGIRAKLIKLRNGLEAKTNSSWGFGLIEDMRSEEIMYSVCFECGKAVFKS